MKRTIIQIDESRCNGCGICVKGCHEGALQLIDGKAILVSELYCDGLGACLGDCPQQAILLEEREAEAYDEHQVMLHMLPKGEKVIAVHLRHLANHGQHDYIQQAIDILKENNFPIPSFESEVPTFVNMKASTSETCPPSVSESGCPGSRSLAFVPQSQKKNTMQLPSIALIQL